MPAFRNRASNPTVPLIDLQGEVLKELQPYKQTFPAFLEPRKPTFSI
jgi:hypothetical protein